MLKRKIKGATNHLGAPCNWTENDPEVNGLYVRVEMDQGHRVFSSAWEPTPDELKILNAGGSIVVKCLGGQPPIYLTAENQ